MPMVLGSCLFILRIVGCQSLKEKRFVLKSLKDRIAHRFNVSIAEVDYQDLWQKAALGVAMVSSNRMIVEKTFNQILSLVEQDGRAEILEASKEID